MSEWAWALRGAVLVAQPVVRVAQPRREINVHDLIACPTCRARMDEGCRTKSGRRTTPHGSRLVAKVCICGGKIDYHRKLCDSCRDAALRESKRDYARRARAARRVAA